MDSQVRNKIIIIGCVFIFIILGSSLIYYLATRPDEQSPTTIIQQEENQVFVGFDSLLGRGITSTRLEQIESQFTVFIRDTYTPETIATLNTQTIRQQTSDNIVNYSFTVRINDDTYATQVELINPELTAVEIVNQSGETVYSTAYDQAPRTRP